MSKLSIEVPIVPEHRVFFHTQIATGYLSNGDEIHLSQAAAGRLLLFTIGERRYSLDTADLCREVAQVDALNQQGNMTNGSGPDSGA